jgi:3-oxoacyl-[acyl-carrier protein] reductase
VTFARPGPLSDPLSGRAAIVVGGTRGIGGAISRGLAARGAQVAMFYQSREAEAEKFAEEIGGLALHCDVSDLVWQDRAIDEAVAQLGRLDILVCNAGLTITGALADYADDAFDRSFAVNTRAPFYAARKAAKVMVDDGRVILIGSSISETLPGPGATLYAASKAALAGMVRGLARDLGERRITANLVNPGPIATERNPPGSDRGNVGAGPLVLKRYGTPEEVAALVVHLALPEGAYITGQVYNVDGGWTV